MPNFFTNESRKASVTLRNQSPINIPIAAVFSMVNPAGNGIIAGTGSGVIPAEGQLVIDFTVNTTQYGPGTWTPLISVTNPENTVSYLTVQASEKVYIYAPAISLVSVTWT